MIVNKRMMMLKTNNKTMLAKQRSTSLK